MIQRALLRGRVVAMGPGLAQSPAGRDLVTAGGLLVNEEEFAPPTLYAASDALIMTSAWEAFPFVPLEAMRAGIPVVSFSVGDISAQVEDQVTGYVVGPGEVSALVDRVDRLLGSEALRRQMGEAGTHRVQIEFSIDKMVQEVRGIYEQVTK
ncbi:glycosyltransferase [Actinomycetospora sp. C-140]